jgi:hypothetical protein
MTKVYISGKITGLPMDHVIEKFEAAEQWLIKEGHYDIVNPVKLDHSANTEQDWALFMKTDLKAFLDCDAILMLPCWPSSDGANLELLIARQLRYDIFWLE